MQISSLTKEYVRVAVAATEAGAPVIPTGDVVQMAFTVNGADPVGGDWKSATWETSGSIYYARCLVGPGGTVALAVGHYLVWVKVTDSPEVPVRSAGFLDVT